MSQVMGGVEKLGESQISLPCAGYARLPLLAHLTCSIPSQLLCLFQQGLCSELSLLFLRNLFFSPNQIRTQREFFFFAFPLQIPSSFQTCLEGTVMSHLLTKISLTLNTWRFTCFSDSSKEVEPLWHRDLGKMCVRWF